MYDRFCILLKHQPIEEKNNGGFMNMHLVFWEIKPISET